MDSRAPAIQLYPPLARQVPDIAFTIRGPAWDYRRESCSKLFHGLGKTGRQLGMLVLERSVHDETNELKRGTVLGKIGDLALVVVVDVYDELPEPG